MGAAGPLIVLPREADLPSTQVGIHNNVRTYIHNYIHAHTHMHTYILHRLHACMYTCIYIHKIHTYFIHIHTHTHAQHMYTCLHTCIHAYIHAYMHTCIYIHTCMYTYHLLANSQATRSGCRERTPFPPSRRSFIWYYRTGTDILLLIKYDPVKYVIGIFIISTA